MKKQLAIGFVVALFTIFFALAGFASAVESDDILDDETTITGMVEQEGDTFILKEIDGYQYTMTGKDLSDMVGKKVQATGELLIEEDNNIFSVNEIVRLPDDKLELYRPFEAGSH